MAPNMYLLRLNFSVAHLDHSAPLKKNCKANILKSSFYPVSSALIYIIFSCLIWVVIIPQVNQEKVQFCWSESKI